MLVMATSDVNERLGAALEAAQTGPVCIRDEDRDVAVLLSMEDYARLRGDRVAAFEVLCDRIAGKAAMRGMTDEVFDDLMRDVR